MTTHKMTPAPKTAATLSTLAATLLLLLALPFAPGLMPASAVLAQVALAGERVGRAGERQLGNDDAAQRLTTGVKALPKSLEGEK